MSTLDTLLNTRNPKMTPDDTGEVTEYGEEIEAEIEDFDGSHALPEGEGGEE